MKILIMSDSHGDSRGLLNIIAKHKSEISAIVFAGDGMEEILKAQKLHPSLTFYAVKGNNDFFSNEAESRIINLSVLNVKIFLTHSHILGFYMREQRLAEAAALSGCSIAIYGHTHVPFEGMVAGVLLINPGSLSQPRGGSEKSYAILNLANPNLPSCEFYTI